MKLIANLALLISTPAPHYAIDGAVDDKWKRYLFYLSFSYQPSALSFSYVHAELSRRWRLAFIARENLVLADR